MKHVSTAAMCVLLMALGGCGGARPNQGALGKQSQRLDTGQELCVSNPADKAADLRQRLNNPPPPFAPRCEQACIDADTPFALTQRPLCEYPGGHDSHNPPTLCCENLPISHDETGNPLFPHGWHPFLTCVFVHGKLVCVTARQSDTGSCEEPDYVCHDADGDQLIDVVRIRVDVDKDGDGERDDGKVDVPVIADTHIDLDGNGTHDSQLKDQDGDRIPDDADPTPKGEAWRPAGAIDFGDLDGLLDPDVLVIDSGGVQIMMSKADIDAATDLDIIAGAIPVTVSIPGLLNGRGFGIKHISATLATAEIRTAKAYVLFSPRTAAIAMQLMLPGVNVFRAIARGLVAQGKVDKEGDKSAGERVAEYAAENPDPEQLQQAYRVGLSILRAAEIGPKSADPVDPASGKFQLDFTLLSTAGVTLKARHAPGGALGRGFAVTLVDESLLATRRPSDAALPQMPGAPIHHFSELLLTRAGATYRYVPHATISGLYVCPDTNDAIRPVEGLSCSRQAFVRRDATGTLTTYHTDPQNADQYFGGIHKISGVDSRVLEVERGVEGHNYAGALDGSYRDLVARILVKKGDVEVAEFAFDYNSVDLVSRIVAKRLDHDYPEQTAQTFEVMYDQYRQFVYGVRSRAGEGADTGDIFRVSWAGSSGDPIVSGVMPSAISASACEPAPSWPAGRIVGFHLPQNFTDGAQPTWDENAEAPWLPLTSYTTVEWDAAGRYVTAVTTGPQHGAHRYTRLPQGDGSLHVLIEQPGGKCTSRLEFDNKNRLTKLDRCGSGQRATSYVYATERDSHPSETHFADGRTVTHVRHNGSTSPFMRFVETRTQTTFVNGVKRTSERSYEPALASLIGEMRYQGDQQTPTALPTIFLQEIHGLSVGDYNQMFEQWGVQQPSLVQGVLSGVAPLARATSHVVRAYRADKPQQATTTIFNGFGEPISRTDALGKSTEYRYDDRHRVDKITVDPNGAQPLVTSYTYQDESDGSVITTVTSPTGATRSRKVHPADNLLLEEKVYHASVDGQPAQSTVVSYQYDGSQRVTQKTTLFPDGRRKSKRVLYHSDNQPHRVILELFDNNGSAAYATLESLSEYDVYGNVTRTLKSDGSETVFEYNQYRQKTRETFNPGRDNEAVTEFGYDAVGRLNSTTSPDLTITEHTFDDLGRAYKTVASKADGSQQIQTKVFRANELDQVERVIVERLTPAGQRVTISETSTTYADAQGFPRLVAEVRQTYHAYGASTQPPDDLDANQSYRVSATVYDTQGRVKEQYGRDNTKVVTQYDPKFGFPKTTLKYTPDGELISREDVVTNLAQGKPASISHTNADGSVLVTSTQYNEVGQPTLVERSRDGVLLSSSEAAYDSQGRVVGVTDTRTGHLEIEHLPLRKVVKRYGFGTVPRTTEERFNVHGDLVELLNDNGHARTRTYNDLRQLVSAKDADGRETTFSYGRWGRLTQVTEPDGTQKKMTYDAVGRIARVDYQHAQPDKYDRLNALVYHYDQLTGDSTQVLTGTMSLGQTSQPFEISQSTTSAATGAVGATRSIRIGKTLVSEQSLGTVLKRSQHGQPALVTQPNQDFDGVEYCALSYGSGANDYARLQSKRCGPTAATISDTRFSVTFDARGRRAEVLYPGVGDLSQRRVNNYVWQENGLLASVVTRKGGNALASVTVNSDWLTGRVHDVDRQRLGIGGSARSYTYNDFNELEGETRTGLLPGTDTQAFDGSGNMTSRTRDNGSGASMTATRTPDQNERLVQVQTGSASETLSYDLRGNRISDANGSYVYDARNMLRRRVDQNTGEASSYVYSPDGQLLLVARGEHLIHLVRNGATILGRRILAISDLTQAIRVERYRYAGAEIAQAVVTDASGVKTVDVHANPLRGDVQALYEGDKLKQVYRYTAFGERRAFTATGDPVDPNTELFALGYAGAYSEGSLTFLGPRVFDTRLGVALQADPSRIAGGHGPDGKTNVYAAMGNNPVAFVDPSGLIPVPSSVENADCTGEACANALAQFGFDVLESEVDEGAGFRHWSATRLNTIDLNNPFVSGVPDSLLGVRQVEIIELKDGAIVFLTTVDAELLQQDLGVREIGANLISAGAMRAERLERARFIQAKARAAEAQQKAAQEKSEEGSGLTWAETIIRYGSPVVMLVDGIDRLVHGGSSTGWADSTARGATFAAAFLPIAGEVIDGLDTAYYAWNGEWGNASLSGAGLLVPFVPGKVFTGGRKVVSGLASAGDESGDVLKAIDKLKTGNELADAPIGTHARLDGWRRTLKENYGITLNVTDDVADLQGDIARVEGMMMHIHPQASRLTFRHEMDHVRTMAANGALGSTSFNPWIEGLYELRAYGREGAMMVRMAGRGHTVDLAKTLGERIERMGRYGAAASQKPAAIDAMRAGRLFNGF